MARPAGGGVPGRDPVERFGSFVEVEAFLREGMTTPCERWTGALNSKGYGCFSFGGKGKTVLAARWALEYLATSVPRAGKRERSEREERDASQGARSSERGSEP